MKIAVTGATGFLGRYIVESLLQDGHECRCWYRPSSDRSGMSDRVEWMIGTLESAESHAALVAGCDAVVHAALDRPGAGFRGAEGDVPTFVMRNVVGTLQLIEASIAAGVSRFVFVSTCAVHEKILEDRPLDEAHPLWASTHYGAHKAAIEKFVHSYGMGRGFNICSLRPTGIYGLAHSLQNSKWYKLVRSVVAGEHLSLEKGGKEVHAADVAKAVGVLLASDQTVGEAYNCYDMYVAQQDVAMLAREYCGSDSQIEALNKGPRHQIDTTKIRALGMEFGGRTLLESTVRQLVEQIRGS